MMSDSATITELETVLRLVHVEHTHCMVHANQLILLVVYNNNLVNYYFTITCV